MTRLQPQVTEAATVCERQWSRRLGRRDGGAAGLRDCGAAGLHGGAQATGARLLSPEPDRAFLRALPLPGRRVWLMTMRLSRRSIL